MSISVRFGLGRRGRKTRWSSPKMAGADSVISENLMFESEKKQTNTKFILA